MNLGSSAYIEKRLTNMSLGYKNDEFIESAVAPAVNVVQQSGKIMSEDTDHLRIRNDVKAPAGMPIIVTTTVSDASLYYLEKHRQGEFIPVEDMENADDPLMPKAMATERLTERLRLGKEYSLATVLTTSGNFTNTSALSGADRWDDNTSDPMDQVLDAVATVKGASMKMPNFIAMGWEVWLKLLNHPNVLAYFPGAPKVTMQMVKDNVKGIFGVDNLYVGMAQYDSSNPGGTVTFASVWGKNVLIGYNDPRPTLRSQTLAMTFQRKAPRIVQYVPMGQSLELTQRDSDYVQVTDEYDQVLVNEKCAYLYTTVVS